MTKYKIAYACDNYMLVPEHYDIKQVTEEDLRYDHSIRCAADNIQELGYLAASEGLDEQVAHGGAEFWAGVCDYLTFDLDLVVDFDDPAFVVHLRNGTVLRLQTYSTGTVTREHILRYARAHSRWLGILPPDASDIR